MLFFFKNIEKYSNIEIIIYIIGILFLSALLFYFFLNSVIIIFSKIGILDNPTKYGYNRKPVPYAMGTALWLYFIITSLLFLDLSNTKLVVVMILSTMVWGVSFIDDLFKISAKIRLLIQIIIASIIGLTSIKIGYISGLFGGIMYLDNYFIEIFNYTFYIIPFVFTVFWYILVFNSINWSDGVPGVTSGLSVIAFIVIAILSIKLYIIDNTLPAKENSLFVLSIVLILIPAVFIFWVYDTKPKILMGDSGTMFLAFMIATLAIISGGKIATVASVIGVYIIDAFYVIFMRIYNGKSPMQGDLTHIHHRLLDIGISVSNVRLFIYVLSFSLGISAIFLDRTGKIILFIIGIIAVASFTYIISFILKHKK